MTTNDTDALVAAALAIASDPEVARLHAVWADLNTPAKAATFAGGSRFHALAVAAAHDAYVAAVRSHYPAAV